MAAKQAAGLWEDGDVHVIPSKDLGKGYAAISSMNFQSGDPEAIEEMFTVAMDMVTTGYVCPSIRDAELNGVHIACGDFIGFVAVTGMIVSGWFLIVRILDFLTSGIGYNDKNITLKYSKGFSLLTVVIPRKKINRVIIRQSIFQRTDNICDVFIYTRAEDKIKHHVKNVNLDKLKGILK